MNNFSVAPRIKTYSRAIFLAVALITIFIMVSTSFAQSNPSSSQVTSAVSWLKTQQQADGGFEVAGTPGFETPDVIAAIASAAQTGSTYSTSEARAAVESVTSNSLSPLDYVDDLVDTTITAGTAAKLIINVVAPLGLDATDFDPSNDSPTARDLVGAITSAKLADGSFGVGVLNTTLTAALALDLTNGSVPADTLAYIISTQASDGSFNYAGDPTVLDGGADTTELAIEVLVAAGQTRNDAPIKNALEYLAATINTDGSFSSFGTPDPNSTATALRGLNAAGIDSDSRAWRDFYAPSRSADAYVSPTSWLISDQAVDGHTISPYDSLGINTFATSQAVEALAGSWFPVHSLDPFVPPVVTTLPTVPTTSVIVQGESVSRSTQSIVASSSVAGTLSSTGSDASDMAIIGVVILVVGVGVSIASKKRKKLVK